MNDEEFGMELLQLLTRPPLLQPASEAGGFSPKPDVECPTGNDDPAMESEAVFSADEFDKVADAGMGGSTELQTAAAAAAAAAAATAEVAR